MRTRDFLLRVTIVGIGVSVGLLAVPAFAFDGSKSDAAMAAMPVVTPAVPARPQTPADAFRSGATWIKAGEIARGLNALEYAAEAGHPLAQWKLGRIYADGEGVKPNERKAFEYFSRIADAHAEDSPDSPQARFVANAFVSLGHYYLDGIPNALERDPERAREMFGYAASYFRDPDAQYQLARLYLDGVGAPRDPRQAARWFGLSAQKGQGAAQAMLGAMLFTGDNVPRQAARGLMWLTIAKDSARGGDQAWIAKLYDSAFAQATPDEQALAGVLLKRYLENRRE